jgi:hypothetical protein
MKAGARLAGIVFLAAAVSGCLFAQSSTRTSYDGVDPTAMWRKDIRDLSSAPWHLVEIQALDKPADVTVEMVAEHVITGAEDLQASPSLACGAISVEASDPVLFAVTNEDGGGWRDLGLNVRLRGVEAAVGSVRVGGVDWGFERTFEIGLNGGEARRVLVFNAFPQEWLRAGATWNVNIESSEDVVIREIGHGYGSCSAGLGETIHGTLVDAEVIHVVEGSLLPLSGPAPVVGWTRIGANLGGHAWIGSAAEQSGTEWEGTGLIADAPFCPLAEDPHDLWIERLVGTTDDAVFQRTLWLAGASALAGLWPCPELNQD